MIYFVTGNANKYREIAAVIPDVEQLTLDVTEIQSTDPKVVIKHKLTEAAASHAGPLIVEDTSLELACLNGLPGTYIKWFEEVIGLHGIAELAGKYDSQVATARCTIGYRTPTGEVRYFTGAQAGTIVPPRGTKYLFGWNSIFQPDGDKRTFAEMSLEEKNQYSMRAVAARKLLAHLSS